MGCLKLTERDYIRLHDYSEKTAYSRFFYEVPIDTDGNMTSDGKGWIYTWNGENRMVEAAKTDDTKIEFKYDFMGRRFEKSKYSWVSSAWQLDTTEKYVWNNYNLIAIYNASTTLQKTMLYGLDINGGLQTAGGVGGLLFVNDVVNSKTYLPVYDGNGNVRVYLDSSDSSKVAEYDYKPDGGFGIKTGTKADELASIGAFSTMSYNKYTRFYLYPKRILREGRWLSRDPIGEADEPNLYLFVSNDAINKFDILGMWGADIHDGATRDWAKDVSYTPAAAIAIGKADIGVDSDYTTFTFSDKNWSWHFNRSPRGAMDSRLKHFQDELNKAKACCNWKKNGKDDWEGAAKHLGTALHPLQDWVAHGDFNRRSEAPNIAAVMFDDKLMYAHNQITKQKGMGWKEVDDPNYDFKGPHGRATINVLIIGKITMYRDFLYYGYVTQGRKRFNLTRHLTQNVFTKFQKFVKDNAKNNCECQKAFGVIKK